MTWITGMLAATTSRIESGWVLRAGQTISPGDALFLHQPDRLRLADRALSRVGDERDVTCRLQHALASHRQFGKERVGEVVDDQANDVRARPAQIGSAAVVDVTQRAGGFCHPAAGLGPDQTASLQGQ